MSQVVASQPYCLENSIHLTRPGSDAFYQTDSRNDPIVIDKHQVKRLYRLQKAPNVNTSLHLDTSDVSYESSGYFENVVRKQKDESYVQPVTSVYHRPADMSDESMARFSLGKSRPDPQRIVPSQTTIVRNHPAAPIRLRHDQNIIPRFIDRSVSDKVIRGRLGPGGILNPEEDCQQAELYFRSRLSSQPNSSYNPRKQQRSKIDQLKRDELARHFMYTSTQQAAYADVPWDSKLPSILPVPLTTYEANGSDPVFKSKSLSSFNDSRTYDILEWDRTQTRKTHFYRKPIDNVAPLPRAQQISGYSGSISGYNIQDIDNPTVDFKPYTVVRTDQPKFTLNSYKTNIPYYTGSTHWTKTGPVSHHDEFGHPYTTTAAFHKSLPLDFSYYRHSGLNGQLSRAVTTVLPQNPFNQIDNYSSTINGSVDSRSHFSIRQLPGKTLPPPPPKDITKTEEPIVPNETNN